MIYRFDKTGSKLYNMINEIGKWETLENVQLNAIMYEQKSFGTLREAKEQCLLKANCAGIASSSIISWFGTVLYPAVMYEDQNPITFRSGMVSGKA